MATKNMKEYMKNYMKDYIKNENKGGLIEKCDLCNCTYKKYNKHHHMATKKHKYNMDKGKLELTQQELEKLRKLINIET